MSAFAGITAKASAIRGAARTVANEDNEERLAVVLPSSFKLSLLSKSMIFFSMLLICLNLISPVSTISAVL